MRLTCSTQLIDIFFTKNSMETYKVIGLMSGTSLDGLDIAYCIFNFQDSWQYEIIKAQTLDYTPQLVDRLKVAHQTTALELSGLHADLGIFWGNAVAQFVQENNFSPDFVASHGHTIFHQPHKGFSLQIGNAAAMAAICRLPVIADFRSTDIAFGGQGAPLVPIGDRLLFWQYDCCLNLGGIANISFQENGKRFAYDVCFTNMILNELAQKIGYQYDKDGLIARNSKKNEALIEKLNNLDYFQKPFPKSLGREDADQTIFPILAQSALPIEEQLSSFTHHAAFQIAKSMKKHQKILATGGGAFNHFLIESIQSQLPNSQIDLADKQLIGYKEALIFALLGVLRWKNQANALCSVTGASQNSCGGAIYLY